MQCPVSKARTSAQALAPDMSLERFAALLVPDAVLQLGEKIGQGSFGVVYAATLRGQPVAVKAFPEV